MRAQATLTFSPSLVRRATFAYWRRTVGIRFVVALVLLGSGLAFSLRSGDRSWVVGVEASGLLIGLAFIAMIYVVHYRNGMAKLRDMGSPQATLVAEQESFSLTSGAGSATLKWSSVTEVWRHAEFWLVLLSKAQFFTVPLSGVSAEMQAFILERVKAAGGRVGA